MHEALDREYVRPPWKALFALAAAGICITIAYEVLIVRASPAWQHDDFSLTIEEVHAVLAPYAAPDQIVMYYTSYPDLGVYINDLYRKAEDGNAAAKQTLDFIHERGLGADRLMIEPKESASYEPSFEYFEINPRTGRIVDGSVESDSAPDDYVRDQFGEGFVEVNRQNAGGAPFILFEFQNAPDQQIAEQVYVYVSGDRVVGVYHTTPLHESSLGLRPPTWLAILEGLGYSAAFALCALAIALYVHGGFLTERWPVVLPVLSVLLVLACGMLGYKITWNDAFPWSTEYMVLELIYLVATGAVIGIVARRHSRAQWWQKMRAHGPTTVMVALLLFCIELPIVLLVYEAAYQMGGWWSSAAFAEAYLHPWPVVLLFAVVFVIPPALTEETMFRELPGGLWGRLAKRVSLPVWLEWTVGIVVTSFFWGIIHLGYDVHPPYLRLIEFQFIVGPFYYFVWRRFGLATSIWLHVFDNLYFVLYGLTS